MRIYIYLYILKLIAYTESATNPKAVNVQLETVLEFTDKDKDADVKFIGNIQKILKKVKLALTPETGRRSLSNKYNNDKHMQFTNFILAAVDILLSYDDDDLENAFSILDDEIRKYHYKGCKFYELVENENVRKLVARNLDNLKKNNAKTLRKKLYNVVNIIGNAKSNSSHKKFLDYINSLYRHESSKTFMNILQNLENYSYKSKRSNMNLIEITRLGIRSVIFDYFSKLNPNVRKDIKKNIENSWSHNKKSEQIQINDDFVNIIADKTQSYYNSKEDIKEVSSSESNEDNSDIKINILNDMDTNERKNTHVIKKKQLFLTQRPVKNTIKQIEQEYNTKKLKFKPLWKDHSANNTEEDFFIPSENAEHNSNSFKRNEIKEKKKRNKQNQMKTNVTNMKNVEDEVRVEKKRKNKHQKLKANVEKTENVEGTVIVKEETRNNLRSESSLIRVRPKTGSHDDFFNNFNKLDEKRYQRHADQDLETKVPPRKRKKRTMRKQFMRPTAKLSIHSLSDEGMSIEVGHYRRTMTTDKNSEIYKEKDNERHKASAEIIRKHFINKINNLEKQMEEIGRKVDDKLTNDDLYKIEKVTTKIKPDSSKDSSNKDTNIYLRKTRYTGGIKDKLNITFKNITTIGTTLSYHIIIGPEYIPYKNNTSTKIPSTEVKTDSLNITDNGKTNKGDKEHFIVIKDAPYLTDFDYSEAGIMKKLNMNLTLSAEEPKTNERENPIKRDADKIKANKTGLHRIEIPIDDDNEIIQNNKVDESEILN